MADFKCSNKFCEKNNSNYIFTFLKVKWFWNSELKQLDHDLMCDFCNSKLELIPKEYEGDICFNYAKFESQSPEKRKEILKKRAQQHNRTKMKDRIPEVRKRLLGL